MGKPSWDLGHAACDLQVIVQVGQNSFCNLLKSSPNCAQRFTQYFVRASPLNYSVAAMPVASCMRFGQAGVSLLHASFQTTYLALCKLSMVSF